MDDFGNIIYILIAIGWFFWNAYKKSQEGSQKPARNPKPQRDAGSSDGNDPFKSLEDMILGQFEEKEERPEPVPVEPVVKESPRHRNQDKFLNTDLDHSHLADDYQMSVGEGGSHRVQRQVERLRAKEEEEEESLMENLFPNEGFDLRKAVVLNAILERPYK